MLLQFSVTNHRSIKDTAIISLKASTDKSLSDCLISPDEKKQLVPVLALYGANAAGKSNVLHALLLMREMVCGRYAKLLKGESLPQEPFAFTDQPTQPTSFEAIYFYGGIKYAYGFSFDKSKVLTEYLYHWPNGREALIFSREGNGYQFRENIQEQLTLSGRTAENRLYLSSSNEWNCPQTEKAYLWFFEKLTGFMGTEMRLDATLSAIRQGGSEKSRILHEMLYADLGIKDIRITGSKEEPIISALHTLDAEDGTSKGFWLPLGQESVGTQRFFSRIGMWLAALESGSVLVVDEIESSMHPLLTRHLIEMVQDAAINTNHAQLIFTTHDTGLLDLTLLRRDQIWFAEKDEKTMQTDIYALTEFSPRKGENISKGYLQGRYGAIPFIGGDAAWAEYKRSAASLFTPESATRWCISSVRAVKPRSAISNVSAAEGAILILSRFLLSISLPTSLCKRPKQRWAIIHTTRKMVTPSGAYLTVTITQTRFFCVPNSPLKRKVIIWPILTRLSSCGSYCTL